MNGIPHTAQLLLDFEAAFSVVNPDAQARAPLAELPPPIVHQRGGHDDEVRPAVFLLRLQDPWPTYHKTTIHEGLETAWSCTDKAFDLQRRHNYHQRPNLKTKHSDLWRLVPSFVHQRGGNTDKVRPAVFLLRLQDPWPRLHQMNRAFILLVPLQTREIDSLQRHATVIIADNACEHMNELPFIKTPGVHDQGRTNHQMRPAITLL
jgi:hypothetical protein